MLTVIDRGTDILRAFGQIGDETAALEAEARWRADAGPFFGHIAHGSLAVRKPQ